MSDNKYGEFGRLVSLFSNNKAKISGPTINSNGIPELLVECLGHKSRVSGIEVIESRKRGEERLFAATIVGNLTGRSLEQVDPESFDDFYGKVDSREEFMQSVGQSSKPQSDEEIKKDLRDQFEEAVKPEPIEISTQKKEEVNGPSVNAEGSGSSRRRRRNRSTRSNS